MHSIDDHAEGRRKHRSNEQVENEEREHDERPDNGDFTSARWLEAIAPTFEVALFVIHRVASGEDDEMATSSCCATLDRVRVPPL